LNEAADEIVRLRGLLERAAVDVVRADNERAQIVAAERERCAKLCDALVDPQARYGEAEYSAGAAECARRIRGA
jgi:hypothetical protein